MIQEMTLTIASEHVGNELLMIDLGHGMIVSDHPVAMGGTGKGPMPGELLKAALASSAAIAIGRAAEREAIALRYIGVGCGSSMRTERLETGPLPAIMTLSSFVLHVAVAGELSADQIERVRQIAGDCAIARAITGEIMIDERKDFDPAPAKRDARGTTQLINQMRLNGPEAVKSQPPETMARVFVEYLGGGRALVKWAHSAYLVETPDAADGLAHGGPPEALLLAALASCTSVFTARSAALADAAVDIKVKCVGRFPEGQGVSASGPPIEIVKTLALTGALTDEQREILTIFADHCAIGETLRRKAALEVQVELLNDQGGQDWSTLAGNTALCDDGACCIPTVN